MRILFVIMGFTVGACLWMYTTIQPIKLGMNLPEENSLRFELSQGIAMAVAMAIYAGVMLGVAKLTINLGFRLGFLAVGAGLGTMFYALMGIYSGNGTVADLILTLFIFATISSVSMMIIDKICGKGMYSHHF